MEALHHNSIPAKVGRFIGHILTGPHLLASHGDHLPHDPLASPIEPVTDWPDSGEPTIEFKPAELFHLLNDDEIIAAYLEAKA